MGALIGGDKIYKIEPYRSIINLLSEYKEGLELKQIQYAIMKEPHLNKYASGRIERFYRDKLHYLYSNDYVKKYKSKEINRTNKSDLSYTEKGKRVRKNLSNFLIKLMRPPNNILYRGNGKYKLNKIGFNKVSIESDKKYIENQGKISVKNIDGGKINLYGYQPLKSNKFNPDSKENQVKYKNALVKISEGINELQALMDNSTGYFLADSRYLKVIKDRDIPLIERRLFSIFVYYLYLAYSFPPDYSINKWIKLNDSENIIITPDNKLIEILKKTYYKGKEVKDIREIITNYQLGELISLHIIKHEFTVLYKIKSHIIAVVHSGSGHVITEQNRLDNLKNLLLPDKELKEHYSDLRNSYSNYLRNYYKDNASERIRLINRVKLSDFGEEKEIKELLSVNVPLDKEGSFGLADWIKLSKLYL